MKTDDVKRAYGIDRLDETLAAIFEVLFSSYLGKIVSQVQY